MGLAGVVRGKKIRTTIPDPAAACPLDRVNRQFKAPRTNALWVGDFTAIATWAGCVDVAFVIDALARRIVGWRASRTAHASFVLDALEQPLHERRPLQGGGLVHHSDTGSPYRSIRYTERLAESGVEPSIGSVGDSDDNALAEVIHRRGPWLEPIGDMPPAEAEARYSARAEVQALAACPKPNGLGETRRGSRVKAPASSFIPLRLKSRALPTCSGVARAAACAHHSCTT